MTGFHHDAILDFADKIVGAVKSGKIRHLFLKCNNTYSAIHVAIALSKAFNCGVNELPLSLVLTWFEQKAVAILLTLLHLGIRGIRIGPTPPAFISLAVLKVLQDKFDLKLITTPEEDLAEILKN